MRIAVTGGSGFLGAEVVAQLRAAGHQVLPISRGQIATADFVKCDILETAKLTNIFRDCDVVIHCAALSAPWGKRGDFLRQNVLGTVSVVKACETAKVKRLIHVSSSSVYFSYDDRFGILETAKLPKPVNAYAESKQKAELELAKFSGEVFVARPRGMFGPRDLHLLPRLLRVMQSRPLPLLRQGLAQVDITDVAVVADALVAMIAAPANLAGTYNISQGDPIMIADLVSRISAGLNLQVRWRSMPISVAMAGAFAMEIAARLDPLQREPLVTRYGLGLFAYSHTLDISKAGLQLNWKPIYSLAQSLERTFAAMKK